MEESAGLKIVRMMQQYNAPSWVKTAAAAGPIATAGLPDHMFGHTVTRLYPLHTAAATWLSAAEFATDMPKFADAQKETIAKRIISAANFHGVLDAVEHVFGVAEKAANDDVAALPDADFALVWEAENGSPKERHYPLRNQEEIKTAADWYSDNRDHFVLADRRQIATKILAKAAATQTRIHNVEELQNAAGIGYGLTRDIAEQFVVRGDRIVARDYDTAQTLYKCATDLKTAGFLQDADTRLKIASALDEIDDRYGLRSYYGYDIERPENVVYSVTEYAMQKFAAEHFSVASGNLYEKTAFHNVPLSHVREWMGDDFVSQISVANIVVDAEKVATVASALPIAEARIFDRMAKSAGLSPAICEPQAQRLSTQELEELAAEYAPT